MADFTVVDTDILIDVGRGIQNVVDYLDQLERQSKLAISAITQMELMVGCRNKTELRELERFLQRFHLFKVNEMISDQANTLVKQYRLSHGLLIPDAFIAATALVWNVPLVSKNQRDYRFIKTLNLLPFTIKP